LNNGTSASCSTIQFTTAVSPGCTTSPSPAASATNVNPSTTLSWTAGSGTTTGYNVYLSTNSTLVTNSDVSVRVSSNQAGTSYNPGALVNGTTYFWKIIPQNTGAFASGCSIIQFTTAAAPGCSTSPSPAASATNVNPTNTILSWAAGTGTVTGYD